MLNVEIFSYVHFGVEVQRERFFHFVFDQYVLCVLFFFFFVSTYIRINIEMIIILNKTKNRFQL